MGFLNRQFFVLVHRYVGLVMASFLVITGLTGCFLAFYAELDSTINSSFMRVHLDANTQVLDPMDLRDRVLAQIPNVDINRVDLIQQPGHAIRYILDQNEQASSQSIILENDEVFVNPYDGKILGQRMWGDISQGWKNLMPFIYRLHYSLALGNIGKTLLGIVALLWTIDCFIGAYLTFPVQGKKNVIAKPKKVTSKWLKQWKTAWLVRWQSSSHKINFDLHRAGGLWVWAMLFVLAWSAVGFNLKQVYTPVMHTAFTQQHWSENIPKLHAPINQPAIGWRSGLKIARELMHSASRKNGFKIINEQSLIYDPAKGVFYYRVRSDQDVTDKQGHTLLCFDASNGQQLGLYLPGGAAFGDTISEWLMALHKASIGSLPMQVFSSIMGSIVVMLSATGLIIWLKKLRSRRKYNAIVLVPSDK